MKSIQNAYLAYRVSKFVLACGTATLLFTIGSSMFEGAVISIVMGVALAVIGLIAFDGGFDYLEDVGRIQNGQDAAKGITLTKPQKTLYYALGIGGVVGSIFVSIIASEMFADAVTTDKSHVVYEMEKTAIMADKTYNTQLKAAQQALVAAKRELSEAKANQTTARQRAIDAIGGDFARLMRSGNEWVRTAPQMARQRRQVERAEQAAQKKVEQAEAAVTEAQKTVNKLLTEGQKETAASIAPVLEAQKKVIETWQKKLKSYRNLFIRFDLLFGVLAIALHFFLRQAKALPDERTILELIVKMVKLIGDAFVQVLSIGVDNAEKAIEGKVGIVAHPIQEFSFRTNLGQKPDKFRTNAEKKQDNFRTNQEVSDLSDLSIPEPDNLRTISGQTLDNFRTNPGQFQDSFRTNAGQSQDKARTNTGQKKRTKVSLNKQRLSSLSDAERRRYIRYKNRLLHGKLGPRAKKWFESINEGQ